MKRNIVILTLTLVFGMAVFTGCGSQEESDGAEAPDVLQEQAGDMAEEAGGAYTSTGEEDAADDAEKPVTGLEGQSVSDEPSLTVNAGQSEEDAAKEPVSGRKLTAEELQEYTEWIKEYGNYGFLLSEWQDPVQINLMEVFYSGAGISGDGTKAQRKAFLERYGREEIETDFVALYKEDVNAFLLEKVGLSYDELAAKGNQSLEDIYYQETDSFCIEAGDTNYCAFVCVDGVENEEGTVVTLYFQGNEWVTECETRVMKENRTFLGNHIMEGAVLDASQDYEDLPKTACLIDKEVLDNLQTDADASAVEGRYVLGDWSKITKEALQGIWYFHPKDVGENKEYDVVLQFDGDAAVVYYPAVDFYGDESYEWDVVDRSSRGLCPELAIYWRGTKEGELAWYILGISDQKDYFWCNGEVFYKQ